MVVRGYEEFRKKKHESKPNFRIYSFVRTYRVVVFYLGFFFVLFFFLCVSEREA
jgi:hypothetical protein